MRRKASVPAAIAGLILAAACAAPDPGGRAAGVVDAPVASVRALGGGRLVEWTAEAGREVRKDDLLGRIDPARLETGLEEVAIAEREIAVAEDRARGQIPALRARVLFLETQAGRMERLRRDQAVSGGESEKSALELTAARAALSDAEKSLAALAAQKDKAANKRRSLRLEREALELRAPVGGVILETHVTAGETLLPGMSAAEIMDTAALRVDAFVEERELAGLRLGEGVALRVDGDDRDHAGTIAGFGSQAEFSPRFTVGEKERGALLYKVRVTPSPELRARLKLGMPVTVVFGAAAR